MEFANRFSNAVFVSIHFNCGRRGRGGELRPGAGRRAPRTLPTEEHASGRLPGRQRGQRAGRPEHRPHRRGPRRRSCRTFRFSIAGCATLASRSCGTSAIPRSCSKPDSSAMRSEGQRIATAQYRQQLGAAIAQGVQTYNAAVNYRSPECELRRGQSQSPAACAFHHGAAAIGNATRAGSSGGAVRLNQWRPVTQKAPPSAGDSAPDRRLRFRHRRADRR